MTHDIRRLLLLTRVMTSENIEMTIRVGVTYLLLRWLHILGWSRDIYTSGQEHFVSYYLSVYKI